VADFSAFESWLARKVRGYWGPGIAAAVFDHGGIQWRRTLGVADAARQDAVDDSTIFRWFSITKIVTGTAVLQLAEQQRIALDDPVSRHLRWFRVQPDDAPVTVDHLLRHTSGLPNPLPFRWVHPPGVIPRSGADLAREILSRHSRLRSRPGAVARYSNLGYLVLEALVEAVASEPFQEFVRRQILAPARMLRTSFMLETGATNLASPHERLFHPRSLVLAALIPKAGSLVGGVSGRFVTLRPFVLDGRGYGGLFGSLNDLIRLGRLHLRDGEIDGERILGIEQTRAMRRLGQAWWVGGRSGATWVEHGGAGGGFRSLLRLFPDRGVGIAILANAGGTPVERVADHFRVAE
jgi:CubicO group peptidase (beta-lactamase class C family)